MLKVVINKTVFARFNDKFSSSKSADDVVKNVKNPYDL